jgi:hypothetical protein
MVVRRGETVHLDSGIGTMGRWRRGEGSLHYARLLTGVGSFPANKGCAGHYSGRTLLICPDGDEITNNFNFASLQGQVLKQQR